MSTQTYRSVYLSEFASPAGLHDSRFSGDPLHIRLQKLESLVELLEECQTGRKPCRAMIISGAREGTILKINNLPFAFRRREIIPTAKPTATVITHPHTKVVNYLLAVAGISSFTYVLDDGMDVTKTYGKAELAYRMKILLDCDLPTKVCFTKKERPPETEIPKYTDQLGQEIEPGMFVAYAIRAPETGVGGAIDFGFVHRYTPNGGLVIKSIAGKQVTLGKLGAGTVMLVNQATKDQVTLSKLAKP